MPKCALYTIAAALCRMPCVAMCLAIYSVRGPIVSSNVACLVGSFAFASAFAFLTTSLLFPLGLSELQRLGAFDAFTFPSSGFPCHACLVSFAGAVQSLQCGVWNGWSATKFSFNLAMLWNLFDSLIDGPIWLSGQAEDLVPDAVVRSNQRLAIGSSHARVVIISFGGGTHDSGI